MLKASTVSNARCAGYVLIGMSIGSILPFLFMPFLQFCISISDFRYVGKPFLLILPLLYWSIGICLMSLELDARRRARRVIGLEMLGLGIFVMVMAPAIMLFLHFAEI